VSTGRLAKSHTFVDELYVLTLLLKQSLGVMVNKFFFREKESPGFIYCAVYLYSATHLIYRATLSAVSPT
jgi:hypothetical protein